MSGRGKAVMAGLGQARQGMAVKVRRGAVWSGVVRRSWVGSIRLGMAG